MKSFVFLLILFSYSSLFADVIYEIYFDVHGMAHAGVPVVSLLPNENPVTILTDFLQLGLVKTRLENNTYYISPATGEGYIPILSFHKLGDKNEFELHKSLFKELLIFLKENSFHIITDHQYLNEDYTYAVQGEKLIVMGSDDGAKGVFYYETVGDLSNGSFLLDNGEFKISDESMVYYLNKYLDLENDKRNFTFYITFDAIPFRQTGGEYNPGPPYRYMDTVQSKLNYLSQNYYIGNHTLNHLYSEELSEFQFVEELIGFYEMMEEYGIDISQIKTLAYSFGIGGLSEKRERTVHSFRYKDVDILGAFDYDGYFSFPLSQSNVHPYDISRIGVDNKSFDKIMTLLKNVDIFKSRRVVIVDSTNYPFDISLLKLNENDSNYIIIRD